MAAIVDEKIFCCHGGLSPDLQSMEQIRRIMRPTDVPDQGLLCDLLWSDPDKDTMGWGENDRGVSFTFGAEVAAKFLHKHDFDLICRAHQVTIQSLSLPRVPVFTRIIQRIHQCTFKPKWDLLYLLPNTLRKWRVL